MERKPLPDFHDVQERAGEILSQKSNRLKLIEGIVLCTMPLLLTMIFSELFAGVMQVSAWREAAKLVAAICFYVLSAAIHLFLTVPLIVGLIGMAQRMTEGEYVSLAELFEPFSGGRSYRRALGVSFRLFWTVWLLVFVVSLTSVPYRAFGNGHLGVAVLVALLEVAEGILWIVFFMRRFVTLSFLFSRRMPLRQARRAAAGMAGYSRKGGLVWLLCFLPRILLGFLTVGILLLADVLPRMCLSYHLYCEELIETVNSSEESNHA